MLNKFPFRGSARIDSKTKKYDDGDPNVVLSPNSANNRTTSARFRGMFSAPKPPLPITRSTSASRHHRQYNASPCSAFLMGGSYYPNKDIRRRNSQKQYKQKCFMVLMIFLISCIILFYIISFMAYLKLTTSTKRQHGRIKNNIQLPLFHGSVFKKKSKPIKVDIKKEEISLKSLLSDTTSFMKIKSVQEMKELYSTNFMTRQKELVLEAIKDIIPSFINRNNPNYVPVKEEDEASAEDNKQEEPTQAPKEIEATKPSSIKTLSKMITNNTISCPLPKEISITLVYQCTQDRLWLLRITCSRWNEHPIIVVLFSTDSIDENNISIQQLKSSCGNLDIIFYRPDEQETLKENYPINKLRNIGIDAVQTSHFIILDIDFIPSKTLSKMLQQQEYMLKSSNSNLFIIPAFERIYSCKTIKECQSKLSSIPHFLSKDVDELSACIQKQECRVFQEDNNIDGHSTTNSKLWLSNSMRYGEVDPRIITCFNSIRYEPYVVIRNCPNSIIPYYDERFHGYGKNKISYISHLRFLNFNWRVLPKGFVMHYPHPESSVKEIWNDGKKGSLHEEMDELYPRFIRELTERYGNKPFMPSCS